MQIVSDRGVDVFEDRLGGIPVHFVPLIITLDDKQYRSGVDIHPEDFYTLLSKTESFPTTSQPAPGDFATLYRELAKTDPDILSIHMSSGLSGTYTSAQLAVAMVPEANITTVDTLTLAGSAGWQVEAAARALAKGWELKDILALVKRVAKATNTMFTLAELKYLIHGGRIGHMKGLIANVLNLKPVIGVEKEGGTYVNKGQVRTFKRAIKKYVELVKEEHEPGKKMRIQVTHSANPDGAKMLQDQLDAVYDCDFTPIAPMAPVLGAHTGPSMIGAAYAAVEDLGELP